MSWEDDAKIGDEWQQKGDIGWELNLRGTAVAVALREAVRKPEANGLEWLKECGVVSQVERIRALTKADVGER